MESDTSVLDRRPSAQEAESVRELLPHDAQLKAADAVSEAETSIHKSHQARTYSTEAPVKSSDVSIFWVYLPHRDKDSSPHFERIYKEDPWYFKQKDIHTLYKPNEQFDIITEDDKKLRKSTVLLKYPNLPTMKGEILRKIKELSAEVNEYNSSRDVPDTDKDDINKEIALLYEKTHPQKSQDIQNQATVFTHQPQPEAPAPIPDLSEIPRWQGSGHDVPALDFLQTHYGNWLSAFGAEQDTVFQYQIRKHDEKLLQGVIYQLRREGQGRQIRDFVKPRSARTDRELERINSTSLKHSERLSGALRKRQSRARTTP